MKAGILLKRGVRLLSRKSPTVLTWLAVGGVFTTVGLAIKATPTAIILINREKYLRGDDSPLDYQTLFQLTWKLYLPTVASGLGTIGCIIASNHINLRRNTALATLYTISEASIKEYQEKVIEMFGKNKGEKVRDEVLQDHLLADPVNPERIIMTSHGSSLFYDELSGRYFRSDIDTIRRLQNDFNKELLDDMFKSLNDFYYIMGLEPTVLGRDVGWDANSGLLNIHFASKIALNDEPCIVLEYKDSPVRKI